MPGRVRPVGVGAAQATSAPDPASASPSSRTASAATEPLSFSTRTLGASAARSSAKRLATHPVAMTSGAPGSAAA